ncbi:unnamed protein product [Schistosoma margrebowiei]|uniref:Uncharacterized protein n=1 Tax=Schistosoma margrebowiei TaxID=48269 RepID=A0A183MV83_9TREM|nr:unnamed protein product [Schistosoma margrebowiei]
MLFGDSRLETLDPGFVLLGTRQQGVPVILRELVLPVGFDLVSPSFTVRDVTTELSGPRLTSCITGTLADECQVARNPGQVFHIDYHLISIYSACNVESSRLVATLQNDR